MLAYTRKVASQLSEWKAPLIGAAVALLAFVFVAQNSETFRACIENYQYKAAQRTLPKQSSDVPIPFRVRVNCWGTYVHETAEGITAVFTIILAGSTIALWLSTKRLWKVTDETLRHAERTTQSELRAYVYLEMTTVRYPSRKPDRIGIGYRMTNSGQTWARELVARHAVIPREFGAEYDPWDRVKWNEMKPESMVLGPRQSLGLQLSHVWLAELPNIVNEGAGYDFAVWVTYEDTVTNPPVIRQTQLCQRFNADKDGGTSFSYLPTHNCADDDCPA